MLLWLTEYLVQFDSGFSVFRYLTLRTILGVLTSLFISFVFGPLLIRKLTTKQIGQSVRDDGPQSHLDKTGTPTMGGTLILLSIAISTLCWADLSNRYVWVVLLVTLSFGVIGFIDDYKKVVHNNAKGLSAKYKYLSQSLVAIVAALYLYQTASLSVETQLIVPFMKDWVFNLGWLYVVLAYFVIVGSSNAVNLTDGLDGLAGGTSAIVGLTLAIFAYLSGNAIFADYLNIMYIPNSGELVIFCAAFIGACIGFLWYNAYPAQVFMGDTGSLSLGGIIAVLALVIRKELLIPLLCGIFFIESLSVMIQVFWFKYTKKKYGEGRRIFLMSPIHHHYQKKGLHEAKIVGRFWISGVLLAILTLATLKLR